ncbi:MAG: glycosyltransferase, partial [Spirochaetales bacterium]|nr:glycosyltransferase [Spirochaetales bacterium]
MKENVAYVVWAENIVKPILIGQTIEMLKELSRDKELDLTLISFYPLHNRIIFSGSLRGLRRELREKDIKFIVIPIVTVPPFFNFIGLKYGQKWLVAAIGLPVLLVLSFIFRIQLFHGRSYPVMIALNALKALKPKMKIIFDVRSDFPEENITTGLWSENSPSYRSWKKVEKKALLKSDISVMVNKTYYSHYSNIEPEIQTIMAPNNVICARYDHSDKKRASIRNSLGFSEADIIFTYCGSLENHWHKAQFYIEFLEIIFQRIEKCAFVFITGNTKAISQVLAKSSLPAERGRVLSLPYHQVPDYLSATDYGMLFLHRPKIAMAIKTAEYLAAGCPIIVNSNIQGAAEIVKATGLGVIIDDFHNFNINVLLGLNTPEHRKAAKKYARDNFDTAVVADSY